MSTITPFRGLLDSASRLSDFDRVIAPLQVIDAVPVPHSPDRGGGEMNEA